jgi:NADH-quinone oxidoreductase subunit H
MTCLKYLIPISCVLVMGVSLWNLVVPAVIQAYFNWVMLALCVLAVLVVIKQVLSWSSAPPSSGMPGMWTSVAVSGYQGAKR